MIFCTLYRRYSWERLSWTFISTLGKPWDPGSSLTLSKMNENLSCKRSFIFYSWNDPSVEKLKDEHNLSTSGSFQGFRMPSQLSLSMLGNKFGRRNRPVSINFCLPLVLFSIHWHHFIFTTRLGSAILFRERLFHSLNNLELFLVIDIFSKNTAIQKYSTKKLVHSCLNITTLT